MKKKILVIYTGGTIGMVKDASGSYVPFSLEMNQVGYLEFSIKNIFKYYIHILNYL